MYMKMSPCIGVHVYSDSANLQCTVYCKGAGQICEADTDNGSWCAAGTQEISMAEVSVCSYDHCWCGDVHVQAV